MGSGHPDDIIDGEFTEIRPGEEPRKGPSSGRASGWVEKDPDQH